MHSLSDIEVDFILSDLKSKGIVSEDLRDNLLDHICCIIEEEMEENANFYEYYKGILPRFFKIELSEIQIETDNLLKFKNFYIMKKIMNYSGAITAGLTILGALFKSMHWPGAGLFIILGGFFFSIIFMPLLILIKLRDDESKIEKFIFSLGFLFSIGLITGLLFKIMHWPYANNLMLYSTALFTFIYVPVYFIVGIKRPERKFNTIVNSVLMISIGGIFYSMFDLGYSKQFQEEMKKDHIYMHENAEKLMSSNSELINNNAVPSGKVGDFYELSRSINTIIEGFSATIMQSKSTKGMMNLSNELDEKIASYNLQLNMIDLDNLSPIEVDPLYHLEVLRPEMAMNVLARAQQQLAVNETCYFTSLLTNKPAVE